MLFNSFFSSSNNIFAAAPVTPSILHTPEEKLHSEKIIKISNYNIDCTCVPPHNSIE